MGTTDPTPLITPESVVTAVEDNVLASRVDSETVMMDIQQGHYYGLDEVASRVWELLEEPISVAGLCERLQAEYRVPPDQCQREVIDLLKVMAGKGIVTVSGPA